MAQEIIHRTITKTHGGVQLGSIGEIFGDSAGSVFRQIAIEGERRSRALVRRRAVASFFAALSLSAKSAVRTADRSIPRSLRWFFTLLSILFMSAASAVASAASAAKTELSCIGCRVSERLDRFSVTRAVAATFLAASAAVVISTSIVGVGLQVYLDGVPIGFISSQEDFEEVVTSVERKASDILGYPYTVRSDIRFEFDMVNRREMLNLHEAEAILFSEISDIKPLYVLNVAGEALAASSDKSVLTEGLDSLLDPYRTGAENETVDFVLDHTLSLEYTSADSEMTADEIAGALQKNVRETERYTVASGDTLSKIAKANGTTAAAITALNSDLTDRSLKAGDTITVKNALPLLSVKVTKREVYHVAIPFETERVSDDTLYVGTTKVVTDGVEGSKQITADVTYIDGAEQNRQILEELVQSDPVTKVVRVGTKKRVATGNFVRPFNGYISSAYGYRRYRGRTEFHTGTDFTTSGARGKLIVASDGGTVTFAGWKGNYGYLVIINHGNGYETYYAHCQNLLVSVGQKVAQGEGIARCGSTGRSTGPHLHFEIRINGNHVNPMNYVR